MELWIRSQDRKKLINVNEVKMETVKDGNTFIYSHATDLGTYETKERALEVLDEINRHIEELYNCKYGIEYDLSQFTYEMPKE